jgi:pimeloyl-ACP methyl ester carboxylesterase
MFCRLGAYASLLEAIRARGVPASGLDFGSNTWGTIGDRVARLRAAVAAHAATGGRAVLVAHSMGAFVCARFLLERPAGVSGLVSVCGVFGGLRLWTMLGWPVFAVVREMRRETGARLPGPMRALLRADPYPVTVFQAAKDEFVHDQSGVCDAVGFRTCVTHIGPVVDEGALEEIARSVAAHARLDPVRPG